MEETRWNKKFNKNVAPEVGNDIDNMNQPVNDDISRMEQKIRKVNNKRRGFSSLPALDSVYTPDDSMEPSNFNAVDPVVEGTLIEGLKGKKKSKSKKSTSKSKKSTSKSKKSTSKSKKSNSKSKKSTSKSVPKTTFIQSLKDTMDIKKKIRGLLGISKRVSADASKKAGDVTQSIKGREGFVDSDEEEGFDNEDDEEGFDNEDDDEGFVDSDEEEGFDNEGREGLISQLAVLEQIADIGNAVEITFKHILNILYIPIGIWITLNLYNLLAPMPVPTSTTSVDTESPLKFLQLIFPIFFIFSKIGDIGSWFQKKLEPLVGDMPNITNYRPSVFIVLLAFVYIGLYYFQALPMFFALVSKTLDDIDKMINKKAFEEATAKVKAEGEKVLGKAKAGLKELGLISDKDITVIITILTVIGVVATTAISNPVIGLVATFLYIGMALTLKPILMLGFSLILIVELTLNVFFFPYPSLTNVATIYEHMMKNASDSPINKFAKNMIEFIFSWQILFVISGMSIYAMVDIFRHMHATYRNAAIGIFSVPIVATIGLVLFKVKLYLDRNPPPPPTQNNAA